VYNGYQASAFPRARVVEEVTGMTLPTGSGRFRSVVMAQDGGLYAAIVEGTIYKLTPGS
jgi:hypothetical protein